jgi:hypothetical protein
MKEKETKAMIERYSTVRDMSAILQCRECAKGDEPWKPCRKAEETDATPSLMREYAGAFTTRDACECRRMLIVSYKMSSIHQSQSNCSRDPFPLPPSHSLMLLQAAILEQVQNLTQ